MHRKDDLPPDDLLPAEATSPDVGLPLVSPDEIEEVDADEIDNIVPTYGYHRMPIVALGGSAGSIQALQTFFQTVPTDTGVVYVVIVHLSPEHGSALPQILQSSTPMPVKAAEQAEKLEANHVYVIPPGQHLTVVNGHLKLTPLEQERGKRVAVDMFFRSLADTHGPHATAVVLSGADGDGAIGLKRIKERGGLTIAQDPDEAEHQGMPRSAINTGMVDWVLKVGEISGRLLRFQQSEEQLRLPSEDGPQPAQPTAVPGGEGERALREVLLFLRTRTSRDFTYYKRATILRRISRRMQINGIIAMEGYLVFLRTHPGEAGALLQDLLISVTNFFRDRNAFAVVQKEIPALFEGKGPGDVVRVWCAACATGEEAYSMAMLLVEHARTLDNPPTIQVFGCDLDEQAIQEARSGLYTLSIAADVSEDRLARFFTKDARGYRVRRELREIVLFAEHDLLKDAPFSRMDLISCRNLLIYLNREAQERAMDIFHFALRPNGRLFLGTSETVNEEKELFTPLDKKHRLYIRHASVRVGLPVPTGMSTAVRTLQARDKEGPVVPGAGFTRAASVPFTSQTFSMAEERTSLAEVHFKLIERFAPPSVVVNDQHQVIHLSESAGRFFQLTGGQLSADLLRMIHPMLRTDLRAALFRLRETREPVETVGIAVELDGATKIVDLRVADAGEVAPGYLLISFGMRVPDGTSKDADASAPRPNIDVVVRYLEREAEGLRNQLRDTVERYEASAEEYKASNEELQAMNEELRSASEELETSREELQSINEELTTVNAELKSKVDEVGQVNSDLHNFMSSRSIATVFLDRKLHVMRFTPAATALFALIPTDQGRPLSDLKFHVQYPDLLQDARGVLRTLVPVEREVGTSTDSWFLVRLLPYRSLEDRIEGVVLTFVDITERKRAEDALQESERQFRSFVKASSDTIYKMNADWTEMRYLEGKQFLADTQDPSRNWLDTYIPLVERSSVLASIQEAVRNKRPFELEHRVIRVDGTTGWAFSKAVPLLDSRGEIREWIGTASDVTERRRSGEAVRASEEKYRTLFESLDEGFCVVEMEFDEHDQAVDYRFLEVNPAFERQSGLHDATGKRMREFAPDHEPHWFKVYGKIALTGQPERFEDYSASLNKWFNVYAWRYGAPEKRQVAVLFQDITDRRQAAERLGASEERYRLIFESARDTAILTLDPQGIVTSWNPGAENIFHSSAADIVGRKINDLALPEDRVAGSVERHQEAAIREGSCHCEEWFLRQDGSRFWGSGVLSPLLGGGGVTGFLKILRDTTEELQAREAREYVERERARLLEIEQAARHTAEEANAAKDHFLAVLSHELRTPLTPVVMALDMVPSRESLPIRVQDTLEMIERNVALELRFIDDLLDVTRIARGKLEVNLRPLDLHETIRQAVEVATPDVEEKEQRLAVELSAEPHTLEGDFDRLQQVFWNLLKNASKFTPQGGNITLRSRDEAGGIVVEITDTGIGMDAGALERIFNAFEQEQVTTAREFGGLGLGLSIAKASVEAHGGTLRASSPGRGKGATFSVTLPLRANHPAPTTG